MESILAILIRGGLGLILGILFGIAGLVLARWIVPGLRVETWILVVMSGAGASVAGFLAFLKPEATWKVIWTGVALAFIGGIIGAWGGYGYGQIVYPDGVRNVQFVAYGDARSPAFVTFVTGAAVVSTAFHGIYYAYRLWRYHEV